MDDPREGGGTPATGRDAFGLVGTTLEGEKTTTGGERGGGSRLLRGLRCGAVLIAVAGCGTPTETPLTPDAGSMDLPNTEAGAVDVFTTTDANVSETNGDVVVDDAALMDSATMDADDAALMDSAAMDANSDLGDVSDDVALDAVDAPDATSGEDVARCAPGSFACLGRCQATSFTPVRLTAGGELQGYEVVDVTGDGAPDVVMVHQAGEAVFVYPGDGHGGFGARQEIAAGRSHGEFAVGDFNRDGRIDLVLSQPDANQLRVLNGGSSGLTESTVVAQSGAPRSIVATDVNRDGRLDLVIYLGTTGCFVTRLGDGAGEFAAAGPCTLTTGGLYNAALTAFDWDGDGHDEWVETFMGSTLRVHRVNGPSSVTLLASVPIAAGPSGSVEWRRANLVDADGDGRRELMVTHHPTNGRATVVGTVGSTVTEACDLPMYGLTGLEWTGPSYPVDIDRDGAIDWLYRAESSTGPLYVARQSTSCPPGYLLCDGACVDVRRDTQNCGACGHTCAAAGGTSTCVDGACAVVGCNAGRGDCDSDPGNGCEVDTRASTTHCGACGAACATRPNAIPVCASGVCASQCQPGFGECDGDASDGCETNLATTAAHCGACGRGCVAPHATSACVASSCVVASCATGYADCDGEASDGCEVDTRSTAAHCGACGRACSVPHGTPVCSAGVCVVGTCDAGYGDCDGAASNGCETNLRSTVSACGACGRACVTAHGTPVCSSGACGVAACDEGYGDCDGDVINGCETNLRSTVGACGACGRVCSVPSGTAACVAGACTVASCGAVFGDCDGEVSNGCETDTRASTSNCGACGAVCPARPNAIPVCAGGMCASRCQPGFGECNGDASDGCETNLSTTAAHCGACGRACSVSHGAPACSAGECAVGACDAGYGDCDGAAGNGCETDLRSTTAACGACGRVCSAGQRCESGGDRSVAADPAA